MVKITQDKWEELSDAMVGITRYFNGEDEWKSYTTGAWRIMSDRALRELLVAMDIEVE